MKQYSQMKDSGIEWIGKIPKHWDIKPIRYVLIPGKSGIKIGPFGSSLKLDSMVKFGFKVYGQENVIKQDFEIGERFIDDKKFHEMIVHEIIPNDILVTMMGTTGLSQVVPTKIKRGIMDSHLVRIKPNNLICDANFLSTLINSSDYVKFQLKLESKGSIMDGLNSSILKSVKILLPKSIKEQKQILDYLDEKIKRIDNEISKNKKLIELLKEQRQSVINHAVTKGLDDTVPMKDSGIEWIGKIPKHWKPIRLKFLCSLITDGSHYSPEKIDDGYPLATVENIKDKKIDINSCYKIRKNDFDYLVQNNCSPKYMDVLFTKDGTVGKTLVYIQNIPIVLLSSIAILRPRKNILEPNFCNFFLNSNFLIYQYEQFIEGSAIKRIVLDHIKNFQFILPNSIKEQKQIVNYLDEKTQKIDSLISKVESQIKQLKEFKESLISSAVAGKIQVTQT